MKNKKGQALVEFILILPIFLFILFAIIDFGSIYSEKNRLENISSDIVFLIKEGSNLEKVIAEFENEHRVKVNMIFDDDYETITITNEVDLVTPGLGLVIDNPYKIEVKRVIKNE